MRHRIAVQAETIAADGGGGGAVSWATVMTVWAEIKPVSGRERLHAMQLQDSVTHRIVTRYRSGITAKHRILFGARTFNIRSVVNVEERNRFLEILADEGVAV